MGLIIIIIIIGLVIIINNNSGLFQIKIILAYIYIYTNDTFMIRQPIINTFTLELTILQHLTKYVDIY